MKSFIPSKSSGLRWPMAIVGILLLATGADIAMLFVAMGDDSFSTEPDYYQKAVDWDDYAAQRETNLKLGWRASLATRPGAPGKAVVSVVLVDGTGETVAASVEMSAFANARASNIQSVTLTADPDGSYFTSITVTRPGLWEFRLRATHGDTVFTQTIRQDVGTPQLSMTAAP